MVAIRRGRPRYARLFSYAQTLPAPTIRPSAIEQITNPNRSQDLLLPADPQAESNFFFPAGTDYEAAWADVMAWRAARNLYPADHRRRLVARPLTPPSPTRKKPP